MFGYSDENGSNPVVLLGNDTTFNDAQIIIQEGVRYIRASGRNQTFTPTPSVILSCLTYRSISSINLELENIKDKVIKLFPIKLDLFQGYYSASSGGIVTSPTANPSINLYVSSNKKKFILDEKLSIHINSNYQYRIFKYSENGTFLGCNEWRGSGRTTYTVESPVIGISLKSNDGRNLSVEDFKNVEFIIKYDVGNTPYPVVSNLPNKFVHMSFDDITTCIQALITNENTYNSIFDNPTFSWLKSMHNLYGVKFSLYIYYIEILANLPAKFAQDFIDSKDWLKLGFHSKGNKDYRNIDAATAAADYTEFVTHIMNRIADFEVIDRVIRGNHFHATLDVAKAWRDAKCGILGFLGCDDWSYNSSGRVQNYYLTNEQSVYLDNRDRLFDYENQIWFFKTDFRIEQITQRWGTLDACIADYESYNRANEAYDLIVFSHENYINSTYKPMMELFFLWAIRQNYRFDFPQNVILGTV